MQTVETNLNEWKVTDNNNASFQLVKQISEYHFKIIECIRYITGKCALQVSDFDWDEDDFKRAYDEHHEAYGYDCSYEEFLKEDGPLQYIAEWESETSFGDSDNYQIIDSSEELLGALLKILDNDATVAEEILLQLADTLEEK